MAVDPDKPFNREEMYLAKAAGEGTTVPDDPWSRKEAYLDKISGRMDGMEEQIAALATDISLKGGVADYDHLPEDAAIGDAYITEDTGILYVWVGDEWTPLNMQGGGGGTGQELTSADYNFHYNGSVNDGVAVWLIPAGAYVTDGTVKVYTAKNDYAYPKSFRTYYNNNSTYGYVVFAHPDNDKLCGRQLKWSDGNTWNQFYISDIPAIVQTTGTSTTSAMSQDATTKMVYADPSSKERIQIGNNSSASTRGVAIGRFAKASNNQAVAIGGGSSSNSYPEASGTDSLAIIQKAKSKASNSVAIGQNAIVDTSHTGSVALGAFSKTSAVGEVNIGSTITTTGYNSSNYRLLSGLYDGQDLHDAATVAQGNTLASSAPTTSTVGVLGQLYTDTTTLHTYQCTAISDDTYTWTQRW